VSFFLSLQIFSKDSLNSVKKLFDQKGLKPKVMLAPFFVTFFLSDVGKYIYIFNIPNKIYCDVDEEKKLYNGKKRD
jgi:hypothetical protein